MDHLLSGVPAGLVPPDPVNPGHPPARAWRPGRQTQRAPLRYLVLRARSGNGRLGGPGGSPAQRANPQAARSWGISSAGEHWLCKPRVKGSIPLSSTGSLEPHENRIVERSTSKHRDGFGQSQKRCAKRSSLGHHETACAPDESPVAACDVRASGIEPSS